MTVTIRIQYKGEGARKLLLEEKEQGQEQTTKYVDDMTRALSMFSIPVPPDSSRAIWKSGFVLCNYNTTRDTPLFDRIYRGTFRAQSIACKATLDGLSISYIHLFEKWVPFTASMLSPSRSPRIYALFSSSKPVFFGNKARQRSSSPPPAHNHQTRAKSPASPTFRHKTWNRPLGPERSAPELLIRGRARQEAGYNNDRPHSLDRRVTVKQERTPEYNPSPSAAGSSNTRGVEDPQETLKRLAGSLSLQALLGQAPAAATVSANPPIKQEPESPKRVEPPKAPRSLLPSASSGEGSEASSRRPLSPPPSRPPYIPRDNRFSRPVPLEDRLNVANGASQYKTRPFTHASQRGRSISPSRNERAAPDDFTRRYVGYRDVGDSRSQANYAHKSWHTRSRSPYRRTSYSPDRLDGQQAWSKGVKRPYSPSRSSGPRDSPPQKRRYSLNGHQAGPSMASPMEVDQVLRPSSSNARPILPNGNTAQPDRRTPPSATTSTLSTQVLPASATPVANGVNHDDPTARSHRVTTLKRDLWDLRREIAALKAKEDKVLTDLKTLGAPEPAESTVVPSPAASKTPVPAPDDRVKLLEAEVHSLRSRLQSETVRRQLVEESCENERRRRKHAEDLLDDARRENGAPLVVPAMMDAFERIAQLTGEALMSTSEQQV